MWMSIWVYVRMCAGRWLSKVIIGKFSFCGSISHCLLFIWEEFSVNQHTNNNNNKNNLDISFVVGCCFHLRILRFFFSSEKCKKRKLLVQGRGLHLQTHMINYSELFLCMLRSQFKMNKSNLDAKLPVNYIKVSKNCLLIYENGSAKNKTVESKCALGLIY